MQKDRINRGQGIAEMNSLRTSEIPQPTISFRIPSAQEEWDRCVFYYRGQKPFLDGDIFHRLILPTIQIKYRRRLQMGKLHFLDTYTDTSSAFNTFFNYVDPILSISDNPQISPTELEEVGQFFMTEVYPDNRGRYERYLQSLEADRPILEQQVIPRFQRMQRQWGFVIPSRGYEAVLTLYGTEGSYQSKTNPGIVTIPPFKDRMPWKGSPGGISSKFSKNQLLTNTIHEMLHIGVQDPVIDQFGLTQAEKELVIDWMCQHGFGDLLPNYTPQDDYTSFHNQDPNWARVRKLYRHLMDNGKIDDVPHTIAAFVQTNPR